MIHIGLSSYVETLISIPCVRIQSDVQVYQFTSHSETCVNWFVWFIQVFSSDFAGSKWKYLVTLEWRPVSLRLFLNVLFLFNAFESSTIFVVYIKITIVWTSWYKKKEQKEMASLLVSWQSILLPIYVFDQIVSHIYGMQAI